MVFCKECGSKVEEDAKFCNKCGKKLHESKEKHIIKKEIHKHEEPIPEEHKEKHIVKKEIHKHEEPIPEEHKEKPIIKKEIHKHEEPKNNTLKLLGVIILLVLVFVPTNISYQVSEPTQMQYPISYTVKDAYQTESLSGLNWVTKGFVEIENTDNVPGTFTVSCNFRTLEKTLTDSKKVYIVPGERKSITCIADTSFGEDVEFTYKVNPGEKTVTEVRTVTKQKTVQLYQKIFGLY